jgi:hypothetical protein
MAAKKAKASSKPKAVKKPVKGKSAVKSLAPGLLARLPPLTGIRRRAYHLSFSQAQCEAWGQRTKAETVFGDAQKALAVIGPAAVKGIEGYGPHRFAWLCSLIVHLQDALAKQAGADADAQRAATAQIALRLRSFMEHGLLQLAAGNDEFRAAVNARSENRQTPDALESSLTGYLQLALQVRRSPEGEVLADDVGLTEEFLSAVSATVEQLHAGEEAAFSVGSAEDTAETNRIEGRVLRELDYARVALHNAKVRGQVLPAFPKLASLQAALS